MFTFPDSEILGPSPIAYPAIGKSLDGMANKIMASSTSSKKTAKAYCHQVMASKLGHESTKIISRTIHA